MTASSCASAGVHRPEAGVSIGVLGRRHRGVDDPSASMQTLDGSSWENPIQAPSPDLGDTVTPEFRSPSESSAGAWRTGRLHTPKCFLWNCVSP
jgi:hypothetical protein